MSKWKEEMSDDLSQMNAEKDAQVREEGTHFVLKRGWALSPILSFVLISCLK